MTRTIQFTKMHGAGNDYIYINAIKYQLQILKSVRLNGAHTTRE